MKQLHERLVMVHRARRAAAGRETMSTAGCEYSAFIEPGNVTTHKGGATEGTAPPRLPLPAAEDARMKVLVEQFNLRFDLAR